MFQRKAPPPGEHTKPDIPKPTPLYCSVCRRRGGLRYHCPFCPKKYPSVMVCENCKARPSFLQHIRDCEQGLPNSLPRGDDVPHYGTSSTPNVSSNAIDTSRQAISSVIGTTLYCFARQPNVGSTTMRTSASEGRLVTFRNMEVGEVVKETIASPEIALYYRSHKHVASSVVKNTGCNNEVRQLNARWKNKNEDSHYISGEWVLGNDKIHIVVAKKVTRYNGICICYWPGTNKSLIKCEWRFAEVYTWNCDWLPFIYLSMLGEWVEHDKTSFPPLNEMGFVACKTLDGEDEIRAPHDADHHFMCTSYNEEQFSLRFTYDHEHCFECRNCGQGDTQHSSIITHISSSTESSRRQSQKIPIRVPSSHPLYKIGYSTYLDPKNKSSSAAVHPNQQQMEVEAPGVIDLCSSGSSEESSGDDGGGVGHDGDDNDRKMGNVGDEEDDNEVDQPGAAKEGGEKKDEHEGVDEDEYEGGDEGDDKDNADDDDDDNDDDDDDDDKDGNNGESDCNHHQHTEIVNLREVRVGQQTNNQDGSISSRFSQDPYAGMDRAVPPPERNVRRSDFSLSACSMNTQPENMYTQSQQALDSSSSSEEEGCARAASSGRASTNNPPPPSVDAKDEEECDNGIDTPSLDRKRSAPEVEEGEGSPLARPRSNIHQDDHCEGKVEESDDDEGSSVVVYREGVKPLQRLFKELMETLSPLITVPAAILARYFEYTFVGLDADGRESNAENITDYLFDNELSNHQGDDEARAIVFQAAELLVEIQSIQRAGNE